MTEIEEENYFNFYAVCVLCITLSLITWMVVDTIYRTEELKYENTNTDLTYCYDVQKTNECTNNLFFWDNGDVRCIKDDYEAHKIGTWK